MSCAFLVMGCVRSICDHDCHFKDSHDKYTGVTILEILIAEMVTVSWLVSINYG
jgi:hypothetical protein